ncbi:MAG: molecular chaperone DnaJ [Planctomycetales bacterium]|nr:molecular chaperone DnaJ [Planctomycetales bacterium]
MSKRCYYEVLGVERTVAEKELASAYRKLAIRFHPDSNPDDEDATVRFKEAAEAYEVLSDPEKRALYDRHGHAGIDGGAQQFHRAEDIFEAFGELFGDGIFGDIFGRGSRQRQHRGADIRCDVTLTLEEAASGVTKDVTINRSRKCDVCSGSGAKPGTQPRQCPQCNGRGKFIQSTGILRVQTNCPTCGGAGAVIEEHCAECRGHGRIADPVTLSIAIPAGVDNGIRVRVPNEGEPSPDGGPPGHCYCFVTVKDHPLFQRDGNHLIVSLPITFSQAALGATIDVPTLDGPHPLKIPAGTQSGEVFRIRARGVPDPRTTRQGDLLVQTHIETPKKLNKRQRELLTELAELEDTHVSPRRKSFLERLRDYFTEPSE